MPIPCLDLPLYPMVHTVDWSANPGLLEVQIVEPATARFPADHGGVLAVRGQLHPRQLDPTPRRPEPADPEFDSDPSEEAHGASSG